MVKWYHTCEKSLLKVQASILLVPRASDGTQLQKISHRVDNTCSLKLYIHCTLIEKVVLIGWQTITLVNGLWRRTISLYLDVWRWILTRWQDLPRGCAWPVWWPTVSARTPLCCRTRTTGKADPALTTPPSPPKRPCYTRTYTPKTSDTSLEMLKFQSFNFYVQSCRLFSIDIYRKFKESAKHASFMFYYHVRTVLRYLAVCPRWSEWPCCPGV